MKELSHTALWSAVKNDQHQHPASVVTSDDTTGEDHLQQAPEGDAAHSSLAAEDGSRVDQPGGPPGATQSTEVDVESDVVHRPPIDSLVNDASEPVSEKSLPAVSDESLSSTEVAPGARRIGSLVVDQLGNSYVVVSGKGNPVLYRIGSAECNAMLRRHLRQLGERATTTTRQVKDHSDELHAEAELTGQRVNVWRRVGRGPNGEVVIALHDEGNSHVVLAPGRVEVLQSGSPTLFYRSPSALPMPVPASQGDERLLRRHLNLNAVAFTLYTAWLTYTLAHPKEPGAKFVILVLLGGQGTGKSHLAGTTVRLVDPSHVGVEWLPTNVKDIAVAAQARHVLAYDNLRHLTAAQSDTLCIVSTGGSKTSRRLYTDDDEKVMTLHAALVMNGITSFVEHPDFAQRSLVLRLEPIPETARKSDTQMQAELERDMPVIMRGLFDKIAKILDVLPRVEVTNPQRMIDFARWLAAIEVVEGVPAGVYQAAYADALNEGQLDSLLDNPIGAAILDLVDSFSVDEPKWVGTPAELLARLNTLKFSDLRRPPRDWPENEIALSKRLNPLQTALLTQGIEVIFQRGRQRQITIRKIGEQL